MNLRTTDPTSTRPTADAAGSSPLPHRDVWVRLLLYPTHTLPTAAAPVLVGMALAWRDGVFAPWPALLGFLGSWAIHVGGVFTDNLALLRDHRDVPEHPELLDAVARGRLRLDHLRLATVLWFVLGALPAPWLVARAGWPVLAIGALGVLASYGYAGRGIAYASRGLADVVFFVMFGVVAVAATYWVQATGHPGRTGPVLPPLAFVAGLPVGALIVSVLVIDDLRDREFDRRKGWRTPPVRFAPPGGDAWWPRWQFSVQLALAFAAPPLLWLGAGLSAWTLLAWLALPPALPALRAVWHGSRDDLVPMTPRMAMVSCWFALLLAAGIALG